MPSGLQMEDSCNIVDDIIPSTHVAETYEYRRGPAMTCWPGCIVIEYGMLWLLYSPELL